MSEPGNELLNKYAEEEAARMQFAIQAANIGFWEVDLASNTVKWDRRCQELFGISSSGHIPFEEAIRHIHPEDLDSVLTAVQRSIAGENDGSYDVRHRVAR